MILYIISLYSLVTSVTAEMLTATFEACCYQIHYTQAVSHVQNIIEKHSTL